MERLSHILPGVVRRRGLYQEFSAGLILLEARRWITQSLPQHSPFLSPKSFCDGTLLIEAKNAIALHECSRRSEQMKAWLEQAIPAVVPIHLIRCVRAR